LPLVGSAICLFSFNTCCRDEIFGRDCFLAVFCDGFERGVLRLGIAVGLASQS
jgi:hypothetical protein